MMATENLAFCALILLSFQLGSRCREPPPVAHAQSAGVDIDGFSAWGSVSPSSNALRGGSRRLQTTDVDALVSTWQFPNPTTLAIGTMQASAIQIERTSSVTYTSLQIAAPSSYNFGAQHSAARVKVVKAGVGRLNCTFSTYDVPMSLVPSGQTFTTPDMALGQPMAVSNVQGFALSADNKQIRFMQGGQYQLCYAPDGTMLEGDSNLYNNILPTIIQIIGVASSCKSADGCLGLESWHCHFDYRSASQPSCVLRVSGTGARTGWSVTAGSTSMVSWTRAWPPNTLSNGVFAAESPRWCTDSEPEAEKLTVVPGGAAGLSLASGAVTLPEPISSTSTAFTVSVCYCPSYHVSGSNPCTQKLDFVQQFGRIFFWTVAICDVFDFDPTCDARYLRVTPQQAFRVHVLCPPGNACSPSSSQSELKFIPPSSGTSLQSWEPAHPCGTSSGSAAVSWPNGKVYGGNRNDYKDFHPTGPPSLSLTVSSTLEICYCDSSCTTNGNWLHVGKVQTAQGFELASATSPSGGVRTMKYVGKPGSLGLYGGVQSDASVVHPLDSQRFSSPSFFKIMSFDRLPLQDGTTVEKRLGADKTMSNFQVNMDVECQKDFHQPDVILELSDRLSAAEYMAVPEFSTSQFLPFDGDGHNLTLTPLKAGVIAICYRGIADKTSPVYGASGAQWLFAGRLTIRGPVGDQIWNVTIDVVFALTIRGWGLEASDSIRVIPAGMDCLGKSQHQTGSTSIIGTNSSSGSLSLYSGPKGVTSGILINCPSADGTGCLAPTEFDSFPLLTDDSTSVTPFLFITAVIASSAQTTLIFSTAITGRLSDNDVISLSLAQMLVNGKPESEWTATDAYAAHRLAGMIEFPDTSNTTQSTHLMGHKVSLVTGATNQVTIPLGWNTAPAFTFKSNLGIWTKHNELSTAEMMQGTQVLSNLVVCWSAQDQGQRIWAPAGHLNIVEPPPMVFANISLTTRKVSAIAPLVLSFIIARSRDSYAATQGPTTLTLRFSDVGKVSPYTVADSTPSGSVPAGFAASTSVSPSAASQSVCGKFILELWSNDYDGFPMPMGCYYGQEYQTQGSNMTKYRDFVIQFEAGNGLKHKCTPGAGTDDIVACEYHVVMNAAVHTTGTGQSSVELLTLCTQCAMPYQALERGTALLRAPPQVAAGASEMQLKADGVELLGLDSDSVKILDSTGTFQFRLSGTTTSSQKIVGGAHLRLYLWPLSAWAVPNATDATCTATCVAYATTATTYACGPSVSCATDGVTGGNYRHQNIVIITMPSNMDAITNAIAHSFTISGLSMPAEGWFPTRFGAQLTSALDDKPSYTTTVGMTYKVPDVGASSGRIVISGRTGQGSKPFILEKENSIILRLVLGATLRNSGQTDAAKLRIQLPSGFLCSSTVTGTGAGAINTLHPIFAIDSNADGYRDHTFTNLGTSSSEGQWSPLIQQACDYQLAANMVIFAGTPLVMRIAVDNPNQALTKQTLSNRWQMELFGKGFGTRTSPWTLGATYFISLAEEQQLGSTIWASNTVVMRQIAGVNQNLQPTNFAKGAVHKVRVFFRPMVSTGSSSFVVIDAPAGYNFQFGGSCEATDLDSRYYVALSYPSVSARRLENIASCIPSQWEASAGFNRAKVHVTKGLTAVNWYGFALKTANPSQYTTAMISTGWLLWTQDAQGLGLEGSQDSSPMNLNPASSSAQSWSIYEQSMTGVQIFFPSSLIRPTSMYGPGLVVRFFGLSVATSASYVIRIIAPNGFQFEKDISNSALNFVKKTTGTTADLPVTPTVRDNSELIWGLTALVAGNVYGFEARITAPDKPPTTSSYAFHVEFGYAATSLPARLQAVAIEPPALQSLVNCMVDYVGSVVGYKSNYLQFSVQTATSLSSGGGIVITGIIPGFEPKCPALVVNTSHKLPADTTCTEQWTPPTVTITAGPSGVAAGFYQFEILTANPVSSVPASTWTFATYGNVQTSTPSSPIDKAAQALGFPISPSMSFARLSNLSAAALWPTGRNDRPGQANALIFEFSLGGTGPASGGTLQLRGPPGFDFHEDCLGTVVTVLVDVYQGSSTHTASFSQWPSSASPTACVGTGPRASLTVPQGLTLADSYAFRIGVKNNPTSTPTRNVWSIEFFSKASIPFSGFNIWTFGDAEVRPASTARFDMSPVAVRFRPQNSIPAHTGILVVTAPSGFVFSNTSGTMCSAELAAIFSNENRIYEAMELNCSLASASELVLQIIGTRALQAGQLHSLTAQVRNPGIDINAGTWRLQSFTMSPQSVANALDDVAMPGYVTSQSMTQWVVTNTQNVLKGTFLAEVQFLLTIGTDIGPDDSVIVIAPTGAIIADLDTCKDFAWTSNLMQDNSPNCPCTVGQDIQNCAMTWNVNSTFSNTTAFSFKLTMRNPPNMPLMVENIWKVVQLRMHVAIASRAVASWNVQPQLSGVSISLTGSMKAIGSISEIQVSFVAVNSAGAVNITAVSPIGFEFNNASVSSPHTVDYSHTSGPTIVVKSLITYGQTTSMVIYGVKLAPTGGETTFNLITMTDSAFGLASRKDELLDIRHGFRLPGRVTLINSSLISQYAKSPAVYPVRSTFRPRVGEDGWAEFAFSFSQPVNSGDVLKISSAALTLYTIKSADFRLSDASNMSKQFSISQSTTHLLRVTLHENLVVGTVYIASCWVNPQGDGPSNWRFETEVVASPQYPTNTNDGDVLNFQPLQQTVFTVATVHAPPTKLIDATLTFVAGTILLGPLILIVPETFIVLSGTCGTNCNITATGFYPGTYRQAVNLSNATGGAPLITAPLQLQVQLPPLSPPSVAWLLRAFDSAGNITSWGTSSGFPMETMHGVKVYYNALLGSTSTSVVVTFESRVSGGTHLLLRAPLQYGIYCSTAGALKQLALPGDNPFCEDNHGSTNPNKVRELVLRLNGTTLGTGQFAFGVLCDLPANATAAAAISGINGSWALSVRINTTIVESIYGIPPLPITSASVSSPVLAWSISEADRVSDITMGFTVQAPVSNIQAVLFVFPERVLHNVLTPSDFQVLGAGFPASVNNQNLLLTQMSSIRLSIIPGSTVPAGTFRFQFPVLLPSAMPPLNLWHIALCGTTTCLQPDDAGVVVSFVLAGFNIGERSNSALVAAQATSHAPHCSPKTWIIASFVGLMLPCFFNMIMLRG